MQVEPLKNMHQQSDLKNYLRIATISSKTALCYFYLGQDSECLKLLNESFSLGLKADSFEGAKKIITANEVYPIDVIIIDVNYNAREIKDFYSFLKNRNLHFIPIVYNGRHLKNETALRQDEAIDDIIDLYNWQYDFYNKISFLKKSKQYNLSKGSPHLEVEPNSSVFKRMFDIIVSLTLITLLLPFFIIIALAVKLESKGPVFYNANRAGKGFKIFKFYKFRTMVVNADEKIQSLAHLNQYSDSKVGARFFKISNDPRITKVGRFLRNTSLDELPQLFNVLKGDMSLVGNRPLPLYEAATLTTNEFVERFMAPAGITGLWQVKKRGRAEMSIEERIELDITYARKASLLYDLWIMAKTPSALFQKSDV